MSIVLLVIGFSLIVLIHEAGHFLAAKYVGIRCEQFALGFGQAIFTWRKGIGFRIGSSEKEYTRRIAERAATYADGKSPSSEQLQRAAQELGLGDTEYRFNWIPLGGYVKMMGQDDTKPGLVVNDPRSYTSKTVGQRMLVISAGVIMNIIFAFVAFMVLFMTTGLKGLAPVVGMVTPMSPAQLAVNEKGDPAPLSPGDRILSIDGQFQHDFGKIQLNTALASAGEPMKLVVQKADGSTQSVLVTPIQNGVGGMRLLQIGIAPAPLLEGPELNSARLKAEYAELPAAAKVVGPGEKIVAVGGETVDVKDYAKLDAAIQRAAGRPVTVTVAGKDGAKRDVEIPTELVSPFGDTPLSFAGMLPRALVSGLTVPSAVDGKVMPGDVITEISLNTDVRRDPTVREFRDYAAKAGQSGQKIALKVLRDGKILAFDGLLANIRLENGPGLGVAVSNEISLAVIAGVEKDSDAAQIPQGSQITAVGDVQVTSWIDVLRELRGRKPGDAVKLTARPPGASDQQFEIKLREKDVQLAQALRFGPDVTLNNWMIIRHTGNPAEAAWWGVTETRDSVLQVYVTLRRLFERSVPFKGLMGPLGMAQLGTRVAAEGWDRLLWFLAIISANLAVVNFLPVPVVDGGHFLFLIIEKIQGKPLSERTMVIAQYIGLAMILTLFAAVTYQDILRLLTVH